MKSTDLSSHSGRPRTQSRYGTKAVRMPLRSNHSEKTFSEFSLLMIMPGLTTKTSPMHSTIFRRRKMTRHQQRRSGPKEPLNRKAQDGLGLTTTLEAEAAIAAEAEGAIDRLLINSVCVIDHLQLILISTLTTQTIHTFFLIYHLIYQWQNDLQYDIWVSFIFIRLCFFIYFLLLFFKYCWLEKLFWNDKERLSHISTGVLL